MFSAVPTGAAAGRSTPHVHRNGQRRSKRNFLLKKYDFSYYYFVSTKICTIFVLFK